LFVVGQRFVVSKLVVERCKRLAERGQDVLLLIDSLIEPAIHQSHYPPVTVRG
jgi:transcription termination factor Rho